MVIVLSNMIVALNFFVNHSIIPVVMEIFDKNLLVSYLIKKGVKKQHLVSNFSKGEHGVFMSDP